MSHFYRFLLLGDPVAHSRSPAIHRLALKLTGLEGEYGAVRADARVLGEAVEQLRSGLVDGINVTMPLKQGAYEIADTVTPLADLAASVNTLSRSDGGIEGHSTDAEAFAAIATEPPFSDSETFLVLGAGGSAAAALAALTGYRVVLSARTPEKAAPLKGRFDVRELVPWGQPVPGAVLINATPLGMAGESLPEGVLDSASGLVDLPYGSSPTPAVRRARELGIPAIDGPAFLARQAALSFQRWTGRYVNFEHLVEAARGSL